MKGFIAFCENPSCGTIFEHRGIIGGSGTAKINMVNTRVGPCPKCGQSGIVPDGIYNYANSAIKFLTGPWASIDKLKKVEAILRKAQKQSPTREQVLREVEEESPEAAVVLKKVPDSNNIIQWLMLLLSFILVAIMVHTSYFKDDSKIEDKIIENLLKENQKLNKKIPHVRPEPKIPVNSSCPCGSGKKYKKCCGLTV